MNEEHTIDTIDEILRTLWLETADRLGEEQAHRAVQVVLTSNYTVSMSEDKQEELLQQLSSTLESLSLGQLLHKVLAAAQLSEETVRKEAQLPAKAFSELLADAVFPNNVPIVLLRNLLQQLGISFKAAEQAIRKTFDLLKNREFVSSYMAQPSFRKSQSVSRDTFLRMHHKADGRELFENEEALSKYLSKLNELMK